MGQAEHPADRLSGAYYWAAPKTKDGPKSLDEVDPEILRVYEKLGIPLEEQKVLAGVEGARKVAVDAVFDRFRSPPPSARSLRRRA
jgi:Fe-S cluster assembly scaffold protein SufB